MDVAPEEARRHCLRIGIGGCPGDIRLFQVDRRVVAATGGMVGSVSVAWPVLAANRQASLALSRAGSTVFPVEKSLGFRGDVRGHSLSGCGVYGDTLRVRGESLPGRL
jgi:hypothetical protein